MENEAIKGAQREMTLSEICERLPEGHRARAELEVICEENARLIDRLAVYEGIRCPNCNDGQIWNGGDLLVECAACKGSSFIPSGKASDQGGQDE